MWSAESHVIPTNIYFTVPYGSCDHSSNRVPCVSSTVVMAWSRVIPRHKYCFLRTPKCCFSNRELAPPCWHLLLFHHPLLLSLRWLIHSCAVLGLLLGCRRCARTPWVRWVTWWDKFHPHSWMGDSKATHHRLGKTAWKHLKSWAEFGFQLHAEVKDVSLLFLTAMFIQASREEFLVRLVKK